MDVRLWGVATPVPRSLQRLAAGDAMEAALKAKLAGDTKGAVEVLDKAQIAMEANPVTANDPTLKMEWSELDLLKKQVRSLDNGTPQMEAVSRDNGVRNQRAKQSKKARPSKRKRKVNSSYF